MDVFGGTQANELDLFDMLAQSEDIPSEPVYEDLPANMWIVARTATSDNGGAAPQVKVSERRDGSGEVRFFKVGCFCVGGEPKIADNPRYKNKSVFFDAGLDPFDKEPGPISGRLTGFLNAIFAMGVGEGVKDQKERSRLRWQATMAALKAIAANNPQIEGKDVTLAAFEENKGRYIAALAVSHLLNNSTILLIKTALNKDRKTGEVYGVRAGSFEDASAENMARRKCVTFPDNGEGGISFD